MWMAPKKLCIILIHFISDTSGQVVNVKRFDEKNW